MTSLFTNFFRKRRRKLPPGPNGVLLGGEKMASSNNEQVLGSDLFGLAESPGKKGYHKKGLVNLGNTCYLNSALQCLFAHDQFMRELQLLESDLEGKEEEEAPLFRALLDVYRDVIDNSAAAAGNNKSKTTKHVNPSKLKEVLDRKTSMFLGYKQQDAHEFITVLLDQLYEELMSALNNNKSNNKTCDTSIEIDNTNKTDKNKDNTAAAKEDDNDDDDTTTTISRNQQQEKELMMIGTTLSNVTTTDEYEGDDDYDDASSSSATETKTNHIDVEGVAGDNNRVTHHNDDVVSSNTLLNNHDDTCNGSSSSSSSSDNSYTEYDSATETERSIVDDETIIVEKNFTKEEEEEDSDDDDTSTTTILTSVDDSMIVYDDDCHDDDDEKSIQSTTKRHRVGTFSELDCENISSLLHDNNNNKDQQNDCSSCTDTENNCDDSDDDSTNDNIVFIIPTQTHFKIDIETRLKCDSCSFTRCHTEMYRNLSLDVITDDSSRNSCSSKKCSVNISNALEDFFKDQTVDIQCEKCFFESATKSLRVVNMSSGLLLHLKRFIVEYDTKSECVVTQKSQANVEFSQALDLSAFTNDTSDDGDDDDNDDDNTTSLTEVDFDRNENMTATIVDLLPSSTSTSLRKSKFKLKSVVHHLGKTSNCGHYKADVAHFPSRNNSCSSSKSSSGGDSEDTIMWLRCNDSKVSSIKQSEVMSGKSQQTAYMLLYELA